LVVDQDAVGEKAAQRGLEQVVVRVDEAGHDDAAARVDFAGVAGAQIRPDGEDLLALHSTSAFAKSPTFGSIDMTEPPRMM